MTIINNISKSKVITALDTYQHTAGATQPYCVSLSMSEIPPSGLSITVQKNGSTINSAQMNASQNNAFVSVPMFCQLNDVISVIVASSAVQEKNPNAIKGILRISIGSTQ